MKLLIILLFIIGANCASKKHEHKKQQFASKQNILFIIVDDLRPLVDQNVSLPNIRNLADTGVNFQNAFAQQALCAPSRNSMLTGRRPDTLRLYDFYSYWRKTVGNYVTIPEFFKHRGYVTYSVGKVFHPGASSNNTDDYPHSWSRKPYHPPTDKYKDAAVCYDEATGKLHADLICPVKVKEQPGETLPDLQSLQEAIKILKEKKKKPFFLAVGFHKPHIPFKIPAEYMKRIPLDTVHPAKHYKRPKNMPMVAWETWTDMRRRDDIKKLGIIFPFGIMPKNWAIKIKQSYFASATYIDDLIGQLLSHVNKKNTIIVLTSDHGWSLGENGLWAKYSNFDVALKVPLIIKLPRPLRKNIDAPVELIDIFPTLVDLTNMDVQSKIPKCRNVPRRTHLCFEGKSLAPLMGLKLSKNLEYKEPEYALSQYPRPSVYPQVSSDKPRLKDITIMGYSIRTKRYRYTEWILFNHRKFTRKWSKSFGVELYDHYKDPEESNNLYKNKDYDEKKKYLSKLLRSAVDPPKS